MPTSSMINRTIIEAFLIIGFILGGTVGVGTIIAMLATGPFIQLFLPYGKKVVDFIVNGKEDSESAIIA